MDELASFFSKEAEKNSTGKASRDTWEGCTEAPDTVLTFQHPNRDLTWTVVLLRLRTSG